MKTTYPQTNFTGGEISQRATGRFDQARYPNSVALLENWLIYQLGGAMFRPGTKYVAPVKNSAHDTRLYRFSYSTIQNYILEIGNFYMRFYSNGGQLVVSAADAWQTSTAYLVGDYVTQTGTIYYCVTAHTSGVFATDLAAVKWVAQTIYEIPTPYAIADVFELQFSQDADTMYITHQDYPPQKLRRLAAVEFTLQPVPFVRGPFLDDNLTHVTLDASADTGFGITLTAAASVWASGVSYINGPDLADFVTNGGNTYKCLVNHVSGAGFAADLALGYWVLIGAGDVPEVFTSAHVGSLWRLKDGVVKITAYTSAKLVTGDVQAEPDGTTGDLNTSGTEDTDWSEGAFSAVRGYPACNCFHQQRLYYANTIYQPQGLWASFLKAYDNFEIPGTAADDNALTFKIATVEVNAIRWLAPTKNLQIGTSGGTFSAKAGSGSIITGTNIQVDLDTSVGAATLLPKRVSSYIYFTQRNSFSIRELFYNYLDDAQKAGDMNLFADHMLRDGQGVKDIDQQNSPNFRLWIVRNDGQIAVMTRNPEEQVLGWSRIVAGNDATGAGEFETIAIIQQDTADDQVWTICKRKINGQTVRYVEYFTEEDFVDEWDPIRLDASLTYDSPKVISGATKANPVVITATSHGFSTGDQVKIDGVEGMTELNNKIYIIADVTTHTFSLKTTGGTAIDGSAFTTYKEGGEVRKMVTAISGLSHLEGETVTVSVDGNPAPAQQTYVVASGAITLVTKAAVVHVGLPYTGKLRLLKLSDGSQTTGQAKPRRFYLGTVRVFRSLGMKIGVDLDDLATVYFRNINAPAGQPTPLFTGDAEEFFNNNWSKADEVYIIQDAPLPLFVLAVILRSEVEEK